MSVLLDCWYISTLLFLPSQSEWLQNWCQPGAAGNWCDQHHGFLCVSLPSHWQLWEVCVCSWERERGTERAEMSCIYSVMFPHIQDSGELPDRCLHSSWRDRHQWVLTVQLSLCLFCPLVAVCGIACYLHFSHAFASFSHSVSSVGVRVSNVKVNIINWLSQTW